MTIKIKSDMAPANCAEMAACLMAAIRQLPGYSHFTYDEPLLDESSVDLPGVAFTTDDGSYRGFYINVTLAFE